MNGKNNKKDKKTQYIHAFALSAMLAVVTIAALTVAGELYKPLKNWLADMFIHHWIGKGVISFVGLFVIGFILTPFITDRKEATATFLIWLFWISVLSTLAIFGFYYYEAFIVSH